MSGNYRYITILLPLANKYKPDGIKATYVKTYYTLVETIREIASNQVIYPLTDSNFTYSYNKAPLFNLEEVTIGKDENGNPKKYGGDEAKLCEVLSEFFPQCTKGISWYCSCPSGWTRLSNASCRPLEPNIKCPEGYQLNIVGTNMYDYDPSCTLIPDSESAEE